jgi:hypothetical protein
MSQTKNALGHQFYMILKFLKKSECYRRVQLLCGGPIQWYDNSDWYKDNLGNRNLDKIKIKKTKTSFIFKFLNTEIKEILRFLKR